LSGRGSLLGGYRAGRNEQAAKEKVFHGRVGGNGVPVQDQLPWYTGAGLIHAK
jgi:hypothetical protein